MSTAFASVKLDAANIWAFFMTGTVKQAAGNGIIYDAFFMYDQSGF